MANLMLINDSEKYGGQYVAIKTFQDRNVLTSGSDPVEVYNDAKSKGADDPVVFYVPKKDMVQIY